MIFIYLVINIVVTKPLVSIEDRWIITILIYKCPNMFQIGSSEIIVLFQLQKNQ